MVFLIASFPKLPTYSSHLHCLTGHSLHFSSSYESLCWGALYDWGFKKLFVKCCLTCSSRQFWEKVNLMMSLLSWSTSCLGGKKAQGTSLMVQWLRPFTYTVGGIGSIPGRGTKISHAARFGQNVKKKSLSPFLALPSFIPFCVLLFYKFSEAFKSPGDSATMLILIQ